MPWPSTPFSDFSCILIRPAKKGSQNEHFWLAELFLEDFFFFFYKTTYQYLKYRYFDKVSNKLSVKVLSTAQGKLRMNLAEKGLMFICVLCIVSYKHLIFVIFFWPFDSCTTVLKFNVNTLRQKKECEITNTEELMIKLYPLNST